MKPALFLITIFLAVSTANGAAHGIQEAPSRPDRESNLQKKAGGAKNAESEAGGAQQSIDVAATASDATPEAAAETAQGPAYADPVWSVAFSPDGKQVMASGFDSRLGRGSSFGPLLINSITMSTNVMMEMDEDLNVMARILEKTVKQQVRSAPVKKLGLVFQAMGKERPLALYLDGYGALFLLRIGLPLVPPQQPGKGKVHAPRGRTWDETRQELYGGQTPLGGSTSHLEPGAEYDEQLVASLKQQLLEALANATHIRHLKPDAYVTVTLLGSSHESSGHGPGEVALPPRKPASGRAGFGQSSGGGFGEGSFSVHTFSSGSSGGEAFSAGGFGGGRFGPQPDPRLGTTLTIRVTKADVDAFAAGKLSLEEFQKKAAIQAYVGNSTSGGAAEFIAF